MSAPIAAPWVALRALAALAAFTALGGLAGCYSFVVVGRASTVARGRTEVIVAPGVTAIAISDADPNIRPAGAVGVRYGATETLDLGLLVANSGATVSARAQLVRAPGRGWGVDVALAPGLNYTFTDKLALEVPLLVGINLPGRHQLVLAPRAVYQVRFGVGGLPHPAQFLFVGGSLGFAWQIAEHVALFPEIAVLGSVYDEPGFGSFTQAGAALQGAVGVLWTP